MDGLAQAIDGVLKDVRQKWRDSEGQPGKLDSWRAFSAAVDWTVSPAALLSLQRCNSVPLSQAVGACSAGALVDLLAGS